MKKKIIRFLGYLFFAVGVYALFLLALFPFDSFLPLLTEKIKERTGVNVRINSVNLGFPTKLSMTGVTLLEENGKEIYKADSLDLSIGLLSLLRFSPELNYLLTAKDTALKGVLSSDDGKNININLDFFSSAPDELLRRFEDTASVNLTGKIGVIGDLKIPLKALEQPALNVHSFESATFKLNLQEMAISIPNMPIKNLSDFSFTRVIGSLNLARGQVEIDLDDIAGDVTGSLKGKIVLMNPLFNSRLDIRSIFKLSDSLIERAGEFLSILSRKKSPEGVYTLDIKGSILKPLPII